MRVLIAEDDAAMADLLARGLAEEGFAVELARDGAAAVALVRRSLFDVLVLDVMLPRLDGFAITRILRQEGCRTPILFLTARDRTADVVNGLNLGADDYLTKPFSFEELVARIHALSRRISAGVPAAFRIAGLYIDCDSRMAQRHGRPLHLSPTEFRLLELLARDAGRVVTRERIVEELWGDARRVQNNTLDAFVRLLRHKVDDSAEGRLIQTVRGVGYSLRPDHK
jgi:DNA-binding response OmpR family regulator